MQQIIAMGGGGFSMEPDNPALDRYVVEQTGKLQPAACFLGQASGENLDYATRFALALRKLGCRTSTLSLFEPPAHLADFLLAQDIIYVGGGNTKSMLALWREWDLPALLRCALARGTVLAGVSAGANCWFEQGITDSIPGELSALACLGFLPGSFCPHYDGEANRRPAFHALLAAGQLKAGYAADDGAAFHFVNGALHQVVASHPGVYGYRLEKHGTTVVEEILATTVLP